MFMHALEGFIFTIGTGITFLHFGESWFQTLCTKFDLGTATERGHSVVAHSGVLILIFLGMLIAAR